MLKNSAPAPAPAEEYVVADTHDGFSHLHLGDGRVFRATHSDKLGEVKRGDTVVIRSSGELDGVPQNATIVRIK